MSEINRDQLFILKRGIDAFMRWTYLDTDKIVAGEIEPPKNSAKEYLEDIEDMRNALNLISALHRYGRASDV